MKLSRSVRYAVLAMVHLAQSEPHRLTMAKEIAQEHDIPLEYLLKILHQLTRSGLLISVRGPLGGFALCQNPDELTCLDIVEAVEGPLVENKRYSKPTSEKSPENILENLYQQAGETATQLLKNTTLTSLSTP